jgi:hypothetical protein
MTHDQLAMIIDRYTPTMLDDLVPASADEIARLDALAGPLPEGYRDFLGWIGNRCPFLDGENILYAPVDLIEIYEDPEDEVADGFILIGIDKSGSSFDLHLRRSDGAIARLSEYYQAMTNEDLLLENLSLTSYLLTAYVRKTLVPSHPFNTAAAILGDNDAQAQEARRRVDEACGHFQIPYPVELPDFRFYGGEDFVVGVHQRPESLVVNLHLGSVDRLIFEAWYDLIFERWKMTRMRT